MTPTHKIIAASLGSLLLAAVILVSVVLPAEYGWDPLGSGAALGLVGMSDNRSTPLSHSAETWHSDSITFELAPFESVEYKYYLPSGAAMLYQWSASAEVLYDMHSEPEGSAPGYAESFEKARSTGDKGSYSAPFSGIHGWFWQNRGQTNLVVELQTRGFYRYSVVMSEGRVQRREFTIVEQD